MEIHNDFVSLLRSDDAFLTKNPKLLFMLAVVGILIFAPGFFTDGRNVGKLNDIENPGHSPTIQRLTVVNLDAIECN